MRADKFVAQSLGISRNRSLELIKNGKVLLDGRLLDKPSLEIESGDIEATDEIYVSRAALKLKAFLQSIDISSDINAKEVVDVGSATGGFVQIMLENGASSVSAIDVGTMQLHQSLRENPKVNLFENTDIREFKSEREFDILTCDISFISLTSVMKFIAPLFTKFAIVLFKPQFEVGKDVKRDKKGVVVDKKAIKLAMNKFEIECANLGLVISEVKESELKGKEGNIEYFYLFKKAE